MSLVGASVIGRWLAPVTGHVLDMGAGDGRFLRSVLPPRIEEITLVDLAPRPLHEALARVADRAATVRAIDGNLARVDPPIADVVLALGITDYLSDWCGIVNRLRSHARLALIIDFPRRAWLHRRDTQLHAGSRADVRAAFADGDAIEIAPTRLHWIVRAAGSAP